MSESTKLDSSQRKHLRGLAHDLDPVVQLGKNGVTPALLTQIQQTLERHELIKLKFIDFKDERKTLSLEIASQTESEVVGAMGNILILFRQNSDPKKRKITVPKKKKKPVE